MDEPLLQSLPIAHRLALSYAPASAKADTLALLALDARLTGIVRGDGEAIIAQMKLAWWRERLSGDPEDWPLGEPLLALFKAWGGDTKRLVPLVDGWETLLGDTLDRAAVTSFSRGKAQAWSALGDGLGTGSTSSAIERAAKEITLFDLVRNLSRPEEVVVASNMADKESWERARLPRALRPLAVLHALSRRAWIGDKSHLLDGAGAMALAIRVGITGR
ncbi:hypothetical protein [Erythrobacter alti]|uniref:hypothetical protein n=1 Tax=Erythrobacter alti TaxID=1896145 RepID=UPI0030F46213